MCAEIASSSQYIRLDKHAPFRHVHFLAVVLWFWLPTWLLPWGLWATDLAHHTLIHYVAVGTRQWRWNNG